LDHKYMAHPLVILLDADTEPHGGSAEHRR
jgi:hypothetical protein